MCNSISHCHGGLEEEEGEVGGAEDGAGGSVLLGKLANDSNERSVLVL